MYARLVLRSTAARAAPLKAAPHHLARPAAQPTSPNPPRRRLACDALLGGAPRAASIVIGNEVLNGSIQDTNTSWLAKMLYSRGVDLVRVEVIPDVKEDIVDTVRRLKTVVGEDGFVFTSGGIGPTHDDITYESIAAAMGVELELHEPTVANMTEHYGKQGKELNAARLRMATLPAGCEVLETPGVWVPLVNVGGVYILPGIPRLFQSMLGANKDRFKGPAMLSEAIFTHQGEGEIANILSAAAEAYPQVQIGSYPNVSKDQGAFTTKLNFESRDPEALAAALAQVEGAITSFRM